MGTNESFDRLFCVDKWVKEQGQNWLLEGSQVRMHILYVYKGQLVMIKFFAFETHYFCKIPR